MAASATAIRDRGISVTTLIYVADNSCAGAWNWWNGNVCGDYGDGGGERSSTISEGRNNRGTE